MGGSGARTGGSGVKVKWSMQLVFKSSKSSTGAYQKTPHFVPKKPLGGLSGTSWGFFEYILRGFLVHFGRFFGTLWGIFSVQLGRVLWCNSGGFKYTSGVFQYISSGFCWTFSGLFFMHIAGCFGIGNMTQIRTGGCGRGGGGVQHKKGSKRLQWKVSPPKQTDLMADLQVVASGGKEGIPRQPILGFFSTKGGNQVVFLVHKGPQV